MSTTTQTRRSHLPPPIIWAPGEIERIERHNIAVEAANLHEIALAQAQAAIREAFATKAALALAEEALDGDPAAPSASGWKHKPETLVRMRASQLARRAREREARQLSLLADLSPDPEGPS
jgi:hypothetical protein